MSLLVEEPFGLVEKLRLSESLASQIIEKNELHADPADLRRVLGNDGSTSQSVVKNWVFDLIESHPERFQDAEEAERFITLTFREKLAEAFPGACEL